MPTRVKKENGVGRRHTGTLSHEYTCTQKPTWLPLPPEKGPALSAWQGLSSAGLRPIYEEAISGLLACAPPERPCLPCMVIKILPFIIAKFKCHLFHETSSEPPE